MQVRYVEQVVQVRNADILILYSLDTEHLFFPVPAGGQLQPAARPVLVYALAVSVAPAGSAPQPDTEAVLRETEGQRPCGGVQARPLPHCVLLAGPAGGGWQAGRPGSGAGIQILCTGECR